MMGRYGGKDVFVDTWVYIYETFFDTNALYFLRYLIGRRVGGALFWPVVDTSDGSGGCVCV